jgi:hypothetical protein
VGVITAVGGRVPHQRFNTLYSRWGTLLSVFARPPKLVGHPMLKRVRAGVYDVTITLRATAGLVVSVKVGGVSLGRRPSSGRRVLTFTKKGVSIPPGAKLIATARAGASMGIPAAKLNVSPRTLTQLLFGGVPGGSG